METIFKEGDRVFHYDYGWGTVRSTSNSDRTIYPVPVTFDTSDATWFTYDGRELDCEKPSLSFTEYKFEGFSQERPEPLPKPGDVVWVRDMEYDNWMITYFRKFNANADAILRYGCNPRNSGDSLSIYYYKYLTTKNPYANEQ